MNSTTIKRASIYRNCNGRIACPEHMGNYGRTAYEARPEGAQYRTPQGTWKRVTRDFFLQYVALMDEAPRCGACGYAQ